jgi:ankyrin repeat protein
MRIPPELDSDEPLLWSTGTGREVWALFMACVDGDLAAVERSLTSNPSLVRAHHEYRTPLYFAVRENRVDIARRLLEGGADPMWAMDDSLTDIAVDRGYSEMQRLLHDALHVDRGLSADGDRIAALVQSRDLSRIRQALDAHPDLLHARDSHGNQPIHWAAMTRHPALIDELLSRGADIDSARPDGARPIQLVNGDYHYRGWRDVPTGVATTPAEVFEHLRSRGAYVDISTAAFQGDAVRVRQLLEEDPSLANRSVEYVTYYARSGNPLRNAASGGHIDVVRLLLDHGADPNLPEEGIAPRGHALYSAVYNGHLEVARLLLEHGAYPNPPVESSADALSMALRRDDKPMVELLCSYGAARSPELLAYYGDIVTAAATFAVKPELASDVSALHYAAEEAHESFVRLLLRYYPHLAHETSLAGKTREITELLFEHGMNPSGANWLGITPLHRFARSGDIENAKLFLDRGGDINARDEELRSTPLGYAAKHGRAEMVVFLLGRGASASHPEDPQWATPLAWAQRRKHDEVVRLLS